MLTVFCFIYKGKAAEASAARLRSLDRLISGSTGGGVVVDSDPSGALALLGSSTTKGGVVVGPVGEGREGGEGGRGGEHAVGYVPIAEDAAHIAPEEPPAPVCWGTVAGAVLWWWWCCCCRSVGSGGVGWGGVGCGHVFRV